MKENVCLQSDGIEVTENDLNITQKVFNDFSLIAKIHRNFYVTVFDNRENRKILLKFSGGKCKSAKIERIDEGEE